MNEVEGRGEEEVEKEGKVAVENEGREKEGRRRKEGVTRAAAAATAAAERAHTSRFRLTARDSPVRMDGWMDATSTQNAPSISPFPFPPSPVPSKAKAVHCNQVGSATLPYHAAWRPCT